MLDFRGFLREKGCGGRFGRGICMVFKGILKGKEREEFIWSEVKIGRSNVG